MKAPKYICAKCRLPFTRKWNANRHCNNKHYGAIENIVSYTEYITNQKNSSIPLNHSYEDNKNSHHPINVKNQLFFDNSISANNNSQSNTLTAPLDDALEHELLPYKLLDQLGPKYEEMQRILDSVPEQYRKILLGNALSSAINSDNPIDTMNKKLTDYRKAKTSIMMMNDLAVFYGTDKESIKELLKLKFKQKGISSI
jgi:hypothetical protein